MALSFSGYCHSLVLRPPLPPPLSVPWAVSGSSRFAIYMTLGALPFPSAAAATLPRLYGHKGSSLERRTTGRDGTKWDSSSCSRNSCTCYFTFPHTTHTHTHPMTLLPTTPYSAFTFPPVHSFIHHFRTPHQNHRHHHHRSFPRPHFPLRRMSLARTRASL